MREDTQDDPMVMTARKAVANAMSRFTCQEWIALLALRRRYRQGQDWWSAHELAHLHFLRWLHETGGIES
ncbi:MAG TPA: hypothetical protein VFU88_01090 [Ktedonobacterales bacterium]|nr:hypothetical protein [Ktedonobacterales bacterium]